MQEIMAIIGAGNMAEAIARGVIRAGVLSSSQLVAADLSPARRELFENQLQIKSVESNSDAARGASIVLLSVKPQQMAAALQGLSGALDASTLFISIAAGISTRFIESHLGSTNKWRVIRTMPNTPMLVGEGMVAISRGVHATDVDMGTARRIFESAATVIEVTEEQLDAVTAVSGSGPAYFFYLVEQMIQAGVANGLSETDARTLATRTAVGAGKMLSQTTDSPEELRRKVTSPGGTTHAAIEHLAGHDFGQIVIGAITAAAKRSRELGA